MDDKQGDMGGTCDDSHVAVYRHRRRSLDTLAPTRVFALLHPQVASAIGVGSEVVLESTSSIIPFLSGVTVGLLSLSLFQLVMSLLAQPPIAILTCAVLLIFAAYTQTPLLVGNTLMFARWDGCVSSGVPFGASIVVAAATLTLSILISIVCVQRRDLLSRGTNL